MTGLKQGEQYSPKDIEDAKKRLGRMEVFRAMNFEEADKIEPDGSLPMTLNVQERKPRRFGFGAEYSTLDGFGVTGYWMHRNLFGRGERLRFDAKVSGVGGSQDNSFDPTNFTYTLGTSFSKPGVYTPDTDFVAALDAKREVLDAYTETSINAKTGFTQIFSDELSGALYAKASHGRFEDDFLESGSSRLAVSKVTFFMMAATTSLTPRLGYTRKAIFSLSTSFSAVTSRRASLQKVAPITVLAQRIALFSQAV